MSDGRGKKFYGILVGKLLKKLPFVGLKIEVGVWD
jgi:hypothetical protein